jgi:hypothetical protein
MLDGRGERGLLDGPGRRLRIGLLSTVARSMAEGGLSASACLGAASVGKVSVTRARVLRDGVKDEES